MAKNFYNGKLGWNEVVTNLLSKKSNNNSKKKTDMKEIVKLIFTIGYFCLLAMLLLYSKGITLY